MRISSRVYTITVIFFAVIASLITYIQTTRVTPLVDYSYQAEIAHRIFQGQMPYRDFMLVLTPGTYYVMAGLMYLTGGYSHIVQVIGTMLIAFFTIIFSNLLFRYLSANRWFTLILTGGLMFAGQSIYAFPSYDIYAGFFILLSLYGLLTFEKQKRSSIFFSFMVGMLSAMPALFKQNIGLVYWAITTLSMAVVYRREFLWYIFGGITVLGTFIYWLYANGALAEFISQDFVFPRYAKDPIGGLWILYGEYLDIWKGKFAYETIFWIIPIIVSLGVFFARTVAMIKKRHISIESILPVIIIPTALSAFLSHGFSGSSYGMWPLLFVLTAWTIAQLSKDIARFPWIKIGSLFVACITAYLIQMVVTNRFISVYTDVGGLPVSANHQRIRGLSTPGVWIPNMEKMFADVERIIPKESKVAYLPGDDPFFAATGRINVMRCTQWNTGTCDRYGINIAEELVQKKIEWVVIKREWQSLSYVDVNNILPYMQGFYERVYNSTQYTFYRRIKT